MLIPVTYEQTVGKILIPDSNKPQSPLSLQDDQLVCKSIFPQGTRFLVPNATATMDIVPDRVNVHLDDMNRIVKVVFG